VRSHVHPPHERYPIFLIAMVPRSRPPLRKHFCPFPPLASSLVILLLARSSSFSCPPASFSLGFSNLFSRAPGFHPFHQPGPSPSMYFTPYSRMCYPLGYHPNPPSHISFFLNFPPPILGKSTPSFLWLGNSSFFFSPAMRSNHL